ncbi:MAG TPA: 50S ribosomal protein L1 [Candidatus Bathyarchaeia archaeon]|nr:50S ribosomal protein L1 [Candidatus Bathyarchaeia archaeon]
MSLDSKSILESVREAKSKTEKRKFTQSVELIINLRDIDMKKPESKIQESVELPYPVGKQSKVCVIASGELALKAKRAGADLVIERADLEALVGDKKRQKTLVNEYEYFISEAPLMPTVGRVLGAVLGPKGRMPTPVPPNVDIVGAIEKQRKIVQVRLRSQPVLQCRIGTEDMPDEHIAQNIEAVIRRLEGKLKRGLRNIRSIVVKTAMGPPVRLKI